jgi:SPW repeat
MFRYSREAVPTASAVLIGVLLGIVVVAKVVRPAEWLEWASLGLGIWAPIAPLLLGFDDEANATGLHITLGLVATTSAALQLWVRHFENLA